MIKKFIIWHLNSVVYALEERLSVLECEPCDYPDAASKINAIIDTRAAIYRTKRTIEEVMNHNVRVPDQVKHLALVAGLVTITIIGMIVLPLYF